MNASLNYLVGENITVEVGHGPTYVAVRFYAGFTRRASLTVQADPEQAAELAAQLRDAADALDRIAVTEVVA